MTISQFPIPAGGIPTGDTAGRPASPVIGDVYYNGELGILEIFDGTEFIACSAPPASPTVVSVVDVGTSIAYGSAQATVTLAEGTGGGPSAQFQAVGTLDVLDYESATTTSTTVTLTVGDAGTYFIGGKALNNFGTSVTGPRTSLALTTVPQAPTIGTATTSAGTTDVTVTWTLGNNGGKNLTAITITPFLNGVTPETATTAATTTATSATVTGLTANSAYTFKVKAANANGTGLDSSATSSVTTPSLINVGYLVVAGGGGGGSGGGGGGGAGGLRSTVTATGGGGSLESALTLIRGTNYTVTVGAGGAGGTTGDNYNPGVVGSDSVFSTITSTGGGGGSSFGDLPTTGGSGGGGGVSSSAGREGAVGTANQGFRGGNGSASAEYASSGGGGAGAQGVDATNQPTNGGAGVAVSITDSSVTYAGGGGGGSQGGFNAPPTTGFGSGGSGGGGDGSDNGAGSAGTVNLGGGGGGGGYPGGGSQAGAAGGSGVVILRYLTADGTITVGAGLTADATGTDGSHSYKVITAGTGNVSWS